jgi:hypothetical protein
MAIQTMQVIVVLTMHVRVPDRMSILSGRISRTLSLVQKQACPIVKRNTQRWKNHGLARGFHLDDVSDLWVDELQKWPNGSFQRTLLGVIEKNDT